MRYLILSAMLGLGSAVSFAAPVPTPASTATPAPFPSQAEQFTCSFKGSGKRAVKCVVAVAACLEGKKEFPSAMNVPKGCRDSQLFVECTNGFSLRDDDAKAFEKKDDLTVIGKSRDERAKLEIFESENDRFDGTSMEERRRNSFLRAKLELEDDHDHHVSTTGKDSSFYGRCSSLENRRNNHDLSEIMEEEIESSMMN